jgi:diketogulonate reductase-like aldo/keto reductase
MPEVSTLTLNNDVQLPGLGLGVFQTLPDETRDAVAAALAAGYRHIDTAAYGNGRQVGEAVGGSGLDRSEVFLETNIGISDYGYDKTLHGFERSVRELGVDQIDLLILHQALPSQFESTLDAYRALETLLADGKVRATPRSCVISKMAILVRSCSSSSRSSTLAWTVTSCRLPMQTRGVSDSRCPPATR